MIDYIKGTLSENTPTYAVVEACGIGYEINISLQTYTELTGKQEVKLFVTEIIREDAHLLFGFLTKAERSIFLLLTSVSGVGPNTARMIMSSFSAAEIRQIISSGNQRALSGVKGIGSKTAQRIIVDLKDKVLAIDIAGIDNLPDNEAVATVGVVDNEIKQEAVSALQMLGFQVSASSKVVEKILSEQPDMPVEKVIRLALKML
ncbi:MAG: Holliday junction branch migration protein RuvA [Paludibacteraceae bacterium]|nr:Holliday junction branch migration protein RuvA [Paludibacteraceae bacterium]